MQWSFQLYNVIVTSTWEESDKEQNIILGIVSFPLKISALLELSVNHFIMSIIPTINTGLNEVFVFWGWVVTHTHMLSEYFALERYLMDQWPTSSYFRRLD